MRGGSLRDACGRAGAAAPGYKGDTPAASRHGRACVATRRSHAYVACAAVRACAREGGVWQSCLVVAGVQYLTSGGGADAVRSVHVRTAKPNSMKDTRVAAAAAPQHAQVHRHAQPVHVQSCMHVVTGQGGGPGRIHHHFVLKSATKGAASWLGRGGEHRGVQLRRLTAPLPPTLCRLQSGATPHLSTRHTRVPTLANNTPCRARRRADTTRRQLRRPNPAARGLAASNAAAAETPVP